MTAFLKLIFQSLTPKVSAFVVAWAIGRPEISDDLIAICHRESRCTPKKVHERDAWISEREYRGQVKLKHLNPACQKPLKGGWATRGSFGLSAGAHWQYMPPCYQPEWFDVTIVSAMVAARKYVSECTKERKTKGWCRVPREVYM